LKAGVFFSNNMNSLVAGREASAGAVAVSGPPALTLVFTTDDYIQAMVLEGIIKNVGSSLVAGFCCAGVITSGGVRSQGVGVMTLNGDLHAATVLQKGLGNDPYGTGRKTGQALLESGINKGTAIIMPDGFQAGISEMLRGLYSEMGPDFQYIGGGAGDNLKFFKTYQFTEQELSDNALAVALVQGLNVGLGVGHGWSPAGNPLVITKSRGKRVYELDGSPAFIEYSRRLGRITRDQFPVVAMKHPLGFANISGEFIIRDPLNVNDDQSIDFVTEVPSQAVGYIMEGRMGSLIRAAREAAQEAVSSIDDPGFMLLFDCISRSLFMGDGFNGEIEAILETVGPDVPMLGALTFGEVGCYDRVPLFQNKTTVVSVGGKPSS